MDIPPELATGLPPAVKVLLATGGAARRGWWFRGARQKLAVLLYVEVLYNLTLFGRLQRGNYTRFLCRHDIWDKAVTTPPGLVQVLSFSDLGRIAPAYAHMRTVQDVFNDHPLLILESRVSGSDLRAIEELAVLFRETEIMLRARLPRKIRRALTESAEVQALHRTATPPSIARRFRRAAISVPPSSYLWVVGLLMGAWAWERSDIRKAIRRYSRDQQ